MLETIAQHIQINKNFLNIKAYNFITNFKKRHKRKVSQEILPKIEVQIYKPKSLQEAEKEAASIIKAIQNNVGFKTHKMLKSDYALIKRLGELSQSKKLARFLNPKPKTTLPAFPKHIAENSKLYELACFIAVEAKSSQEITQNLNMSRATLYRLISKLNPYLEKRGNAGIGKLYFFDTNLIETTKDNNKDEPRCLINPTNNKEIKKRDLVKQT